MEIRVMQFGACGMVGKGVLIECPESTTVPSVLVVKLGLAMINVSLKGYPTAWLKTDKLTN